MIIALLAGITACSQNKDGITAREATRIETVLASDAMGGRKTGTAHIEKAAAFISDEFKKAGLKPLFGNSFLQQFVMVRPKLKELKVKIEDAEADVKNVIVITSQPELTIDEKSGYEVVQLGRGENLSKKAVTLARSGKNNMVFVDTSFAPQFGRLTGLKRQLFASAYSTVFILSASVPKSFKIKASHSFDESRFTNVVGVLPGKSRKEEYVIFSGHYDHLGIGKAINKDSIYNGANDDAAGTTAVIMLSAYFKKQSGNERTLIFAAFTAEEIGGYGSQYFSQQVAPEKVVAMFNIEMIGTESKWGKGSAYITGFEKSNMGTILQKALTGSNFTFYPDPYPQQNLFYRSDNATLARLGVPAHTISTSKMDSEPNYHQPGDEIATLDMENMAGIIRAIALSSTTIISGKETPARVKEN